MAENRVIGNNNALIWHIPEDLKRFKALTMGKPVIMGRKTFESIVSQLGKPLPGRENIVISQSGFTAPGASIYKTLPEALAYAKTLNAEEVFIIGGAQIYALALPLADKLYITKIHKTYQGDAYFPDFDSKIWQKKKEENCAGDPPFSFSLWEKKQILP